MRSKSFIAVLTSLVALLVLAGGVVAYDGSRGGEVPKGVTVAGIDVGGLDRAAAVSKLEARYVTALKRPIKVHHGRKTFVLGPREAKISVDVDGAVDQALAAADEGNLLSRTWRRATGGEVDRSITPSVSYSRPAVVRLLDKVRRSISRAPKDATVQLVASGPKEVPGVTGLAVDASRLHKEIDAAITRPDGARRFVAHTRKVQPKVTTDELADKFDTALVVARDSFQLKLYKHLKLAKTYDIAVGMQGLETPRGLYHIQNKAENPAWQVPNSAWAGDLAGTVVPADDPSNPIKSRWLGIIDGAGIHGIPVSEYSSIGHAASHGCVRMRIEDVEDLYPRVPVGAPIYIA